MAQKFVSDKTSTLFKEPTGRSQELVLIYGDAVDTTGNTENNREEVTFRGRTGWVVTNELGDARPMEIYFIDAGQGDSAFVVTPAGKTILVDGGHGGEALQFLTWRYRLDLQPTTPVTIDLLVLSHPDRDHIAGLVPVIESPFVDVKRIIHNGIAKYSTGFSTDLGDRTADSSFLTTHHTSVDDLAGQPLTTELADWRDAIVAEPGLADEAVDSTTGDIDLGDPAVRLTVLGPRLEAGAYRWFSTPGETVNAHSVVLVLEYDDVRILLPGDVNDKGGRHLVQDPTIAANLDAHVFKAPHHGSHKFDRGFLQAVQPQISIISSGETPDHGHPRANFLGTVGNVSRSEEPLLFSTELVALFTVDDDVIVGDEDDDVDLANASDPNVLGQARRRFKKRLNGLINVRTDGKDLFAARRVGAGYRFVGYGPVRPVVRA